LLAVVTAIVFRSALDCGFVKFDDPFYVVSNRAVRQGLTFQNILYAFTTRESSNWHPVTWLSHMLDVELFGMNPRGHHATSVLIHSANAALLFLLLSSMTLAFWRPMLVAALFAVHPLRAESVAWVSERKDVLCIFFTLLTMLAYARHVRSPSWRWNLIVIACTALALMAKPMAVTLPFLLMLLDIWPLRRWNVPLLRSILPRIIEKLPLFALSAASCIVTYWAQSTTDAVQDFQSYPPFSRLLNALASAGIYLRQLILPTDLCYFYPYPSLESLVPAALIASAIILALTVASILSLRRWPHLFVGWFWYLGTLVPVIGLVQVGAQAHADRYTYLPTIGILMAIVWSMPGVLAARLNGRAMLAAIAVAIVAGLAWKTDRLVRTWHDQATLSRHALNLTKENWTVHGHLGQYLQSTPSPNESPVDMARRLQEAEFHLLEVTRLKPDHAGHRVNLAVVFRLQGRNQEAMKCLDEAIEIDPSLAAAHYNRAVLLVVLGRIDEGEVEYRTAIELDPALPFSYLGLAKVLVFRNQPEEAVKALEQCIAIDPDMVESRLEMARLMFKRSQWAEALVHFQALTDLQPDNPAFHNAVGACLAKLGRIDEARAAFTRTLELQPSNPEALANLNELSRP